jgi:NADH-quinone oxidoreductase subunit D
MAKAKTDQDIQAVSELTISEAATGPKMETEEITVNFGPQHPSMHGVLFLEMTVDGEVITSCKPIIGYLHRSMEKIFEYRTYAQCTCLIDRADYLSAFFNELAFIYPVEKLMGVDVPERAEYIRVILMELNRIASHLMFFGTFGMDIGALSPFLYAWREREKILDLFEMISGYRMHPNYFRIGGLKADVPEGFFELTSRFVDEFDGWLEEYNSVLTGNEIFHIRTRNVGKLTPEWAIDLGMTGPLLRTTGVKWDLRKNDPYSIYDRFEFEVPVGTQGDCFDSYWVRMKEMEESNKILKQALSSIPDGPIKAKGVPLNVKPPKGESCARIESPRGELAVYIVSDGSGKPYRARLRSPSFVHLQSLPDMLKDTYLADMIALVAIIDPVMGEVDR